jgi:hypothetical protein
MSTDFVSCRFQKMGSNAVLEFAVAWVKKAVIPRHRRVKCADVEGPCVIFWDTPTLETF